MAIKKEITSRSGVKGDYINIPHLGNVNISVENGRLSLTLLPVLFLDAETKKKEGVQPLESLDPIDIVIEGENYNNIMSVLYSELKKNELYKGSVDC